MVSKNGNGSKPKSELSEAEKAVFDLAKALETEHIRLERVLTNYEPHPYMIVPEHLDYASAGMFLDRAAILRAEEHGVRCGMCDKRKPLGFDKHVSYQVAIFDFAQGTTPEEQRDFLLAFKELSEIIKQGRGVGELGGLGFSSQESLDRVMANNQLLSGLDDSAEAVPA